MKTSNIFPLLFFIGLIACTSESENLALNQIAEFYECNTSFSKGVSTSIEEGSRKTFTVELSGGEILNQLDPEITASNSALILYMGLDDTEKSKYTHINIIVNQEENNSTKTTEVSFPVEELQMVKSKVFVLNDCFNMLQNKDYEGLESIMSEALKTELDLDSIFPQLDAIEEEHGILLDFVVQGFELFNANVEGEDMDLVQIYGTFTREKNYIKVYVVVPQAEGDNRLFGFNF